MAQVIQTGGTTQSQAPAAHSGASVAAFLSAGIGLLTLGLVTVGTELNERFKDWVFNVGKAWVPHAEHIGPYSGKETFLLVGWLGSWILLHLALRNRELRVRVWFGVFLLMLLVATLLIWPPVWHLLKGE